VRANVRHGKPLTLSERESAAKRILQGHSLWSDRAIAEICGLAPRTIAVLRARATDDSEQSRARRGLDGRSRPLDVSAARLEAAALLQARPAASMRKIARETGVSVATVRDVRSRLSRGVDPLPKRQLSTTADCHECTDSRDDLERDAAFRGEPNALAFARWFDSHRVGRDDWQPYIQHLPLNRLYQIIAEARKRARVWDELCEQLEERVRASGTHV
jgi:hypothetical protein